MSKEERLLKVIQRLETKIKDIWDENNQLKQNIELSYLDKEISEENCRSLEDQLQQAHDDIKKLEVKINELQELNDLNQELEETYNLEKTALEDEVAELKLKIEDVNFNVQSFEALQIELKTTERKLYATEFDLKILRDGLVPTLSEIFGEKDWIPILAILQLDISDHMQDYKIGKISVKKFGELLEKATTEFDTPLNQNQVRELLLLNESPIKSRILLKNQIILDEIESEKSELEVKKEQITGDIDQASDNTLKLRIEILESKLSRAQELEMELESLKEKQLSLTHKEKNMNERIQRLNETIKQQNEEISLLTKKALPVELTKVSQGFNFQELQSTILYLTRESKTKLSLDPLNGCDTSEMRISTTLGNKRTRNLRKMRFELSDLSNASQTFIDQEVQLMFL